MGTCRDDVLDGMRRLEQRHNRRDFQLHEIVAEVLLFSDFKESTIRTHITSRLCRDAPAHHADRYDNLERVGHGRYRRI